MEAEEGPKDPLLCTFCQTPLSSEWYRHPSRHNCPHSTPRPGTSSITSSGTRFGKNEEIKHSCEKCGSTFPSLTELRSHYSAFHYWDKIEAQFTKWGSRCYICLKDFKTPNKGWFQKKKKLMEFSIKLAGWVLDDLVFHY